MFCGLETVDVCRGEAKGNIDGRGFKKDTFPSLPVNKCFIIIPIVKEKQSKEQVNVN